MAITLTLPTGRNRSHRGFTLLELLVAMTISSIIMVTAYGTFSTSLRSSRSIDAKAESLQNMRFAVNSLREDLQRVAPPGKKSFCKWNSRDCSFLTNDGKSISYSLESKGELVRISERVSGVDKERKRSVVARDVRSIGLEYYNNSSWQESIRGKLWPAAVRFGLQFNREGEEMQVVIAVPVEPAGGKEEK